MVAGHEAQRHAGQRQDEKELRKIRLSGAPPGYRETVMARPEMHQLEPVGIKDLPVQ